MNVENLFKLECGKIISNYKEMCEVLDEKQKGGESKKSQIREWERFFKYHKEGHKFVIDEVYETPKEKLDLRGRDGIISNDIQPLVLNLLAKSTGNTVCLSCTKLLESLKMVNENYQIGRNNIKTFSKHIGVEEDIISDFYQYEHNKLKSNLESALNTLSNRGLIYWNKVMMVHEKYEAKDYTIRKATNNEIELILDIQKEILNELNLYKISEIYASNNRRNKFNSLMSEKLSERTSGIVKAYKVYEIIYAKKYVIKALEEEEKRLKEEELNFKILQSAYRSIKEKHENAVQTEIKYLEKSREWGEQENLNIKVVKRVDSDYMEKSKVVCDSTIDKNKVKIL